MEGGSAMYFSLNRPEHWERRGIASNLEMSAEGVTLQRGEKYGLQDTIDLDGLEGVGNVTAFSVGPLGHIVLLDEQGNLWRYDRGSRHHERLFVPGHGMFSASGKIAVNGDALFVADPSGSGGEAYLAAFDMASRQLRWSFSGSRIEGHFFFPLAVATDDRHVYVLTPREEISLQRRKEDADEAVVLSILKFSVSGGLVAVISHDGFGFRTTLLPEEWKAVAFLHATGDGGIYAFESAGMTLYAFDGDGVLIRRRELPPQVYSGLAIDSRGYLYVGDARKIAEGGEDDRFIVELDKDGNPLGPIGGYRGKTDDLIVDYRDRMHIWNGEARTITVLELQQRTRGWEGTGPPQGLWLSRAFDSAESETVWHKFTLDADIPDGTMIRVSYVSSDSDRMLIEGSYWKVDDWIGDEERSIEDKLDGLAPLWSTPVINPADGLFASAKGRYLWIKAEWIGSETSTPTVRRMRVYFPRATLLDYLPAVYREEETSRDFLERYMSLFGTLFDSIDEQIDGMPKHLDPDRVQGKQLRWLASWLGLSCDEHWSDDWVRRLIRAAPELYRYRGTRRGIETLIETLTGRKPMIVEPFQFKAMREQGGLKWLMDDLYGGDPFTFTLLLHQDQARTEKERVLLRELVEDHKPAYTQVQIMWLQPWMYLDLHTYLGVNTMLAEPSLLTLHPDRSMPNDTLIVDRDMDRRMDAHTRLGMDSELE